ncbi:MULTISPECIES: posphoenolpyruvate synthetase regulatory kinase/phosphorylase PpsR [Leeia]|uniref:Putative phosphoenolpyruvate synthase regulatory protein n=1 Tax=Leeia aquatica TaxID=2725557 RepID=A0A847RSK5_9NEIS|nr:pyruvate, water dikinase regulatory protein [Leeia aquatica]NLR74190.1 kinase/pyrophosphorylase [Leeia aquatica]
MTHRRKVFFVSDRTGITAEVLGHSLITQFEDIDFQRTTLPFIDTIEKAQAVAQQLGDICMQEGHRPVVFSTMVDSQIRNALRQRNNALHLDFFEKFIDPLEQEFGMQSSHTMGKSHAIDDNDDYKTRIDAVNFTMANDDGGQTKYYEEADVILVGVSRSGKTPTCLYLALHYGIRAANYPLVPEDFGSMTLPSVLQPYRNKLYGLTIRADRLQQIRNERKPDSKYASLDNCRFEIAEAEALMRRERISFQDATHKSVEELASTLIHTAGLTRRLF